MMNAEVTAEKRPACGPNQHMRTRTMPTTYKYECRIQIFIILLRKFCIVFPGLLTVVLVESSAEISLGLHELSLFTSATLQFPFLLL